LCAAGIAPAADQPELDLGSAWLCWGTYGDDYYPAAFGRGRNPAPAKAQNRRLLALMPLDAGAQAPPPANPLERGLADLWARTAASLAIGQKHEFREAVAVMVDSWLWELDGRFLHRIPDPVDYLEMRRHTFGCLLTKSLARIGRGGQVPPEIWQTRTLQALEDTAANYACLLNDIYSYQKEIEFEGEIFNGVLAVQDFLGCSTGQAIEVVHDLMTSRMRQFERIVTAELPALCDEHDLGQPTRDALYQRAQELQDWMAAIAHWHAHCGRYRETDLISRYRARPRPAAGRPSGLGTSAARIGNLLT
jgi:germacradienol/geosmin synthase